MAARQVVRILRDVSEGPPPSRLRLLAPLRYLSIKHREKRRYDVIVPTLVGVALWIAYLVVTPQIPLFGEGGLLRFARDLLIMAVPFMVGALASVAMGAPGKHLDRRPMGQELMLDKQSLTLRQFVCYLLGYLSFLGMITLASVVAAGLFKDTVLAWTVASQLVRSVVHDGGAFVLMLMLSFLSVTVFWSLYFLTDIVNRETDDAA